MATNTAVPPTATPSFCPGNLVQNASFEILSGINSINDPIPTIWVVESGEAGATTAFHPPDGVRVGYVWGIGAGQTGLWSQQVAAVAGHVYAMTFYSGTHDPSVHPTIEIRFYTSSNVEIGLPAIHTITTDIDITGAVGGPYALSATAPAGVAYLKVIFRDPSTTRAGAKGDSVCLTTSIATPTRTVTITATPTATATPTPTPTHKSFAAHHVDSLGQQFCTLSQVGWGSGVANGPAGFITRDPAILPVTIGGAGRSTTLGTVAALSAYLPARGLPQVLLAGDRNFAAAGDVTDDGGGTLSGETVALTLALYLSDSGGGFDGLSAFVLPARGFCTQALTAGPDGIIGTADDDIDSSSAIAGPWTLPAAVAATSTTVEAVVNLANESLQGMVTGVSASDVNAGVAAINQAFDNCQRIVACQ
ncbi:MAG: hypothetical protein HYR72_24885, partial [Deltaproteobacteria bacterium]|nr:hypothetical protein [Deltaproteobacteria bacterium]MBI3387219.1 hypothetical protein [Deltaproteobacteria bacterium]